MKTTQLKRILVPVDFSTISKHALDQAIFTARLFKADLYVIHVIDIPPTVYTIDNPMAPGIDLKEIESDILKRLDDMAKSVRKEYGIRLRTLVVHGTTTTEIVNAINENNIDLVFMGTHGASGFNEFFIGSNANKVVTISPVPVITMQRKSKKPGLHDILLPIDNSIHSREKLNFVLILAKKFGAVVHILGLPDDNNPLHRKQFDIKIKSVEKAIRNAGLAFTSTIAKGESLAEAALKYAKKTKADLIAILSDHESRYGTFSGPFAKHLVNHSRVPVLNIKPAEGKYEDVNYGAVNPF